MWTLYQFPLCPFSRKVRLLMAEKGVSYDLKLEHPWEGRDQLWALNAAGRTPVLEHATRGTVLCDSRAICEYFEERIEKAPMINGSAVQRAEIRRLTALFDENFFWDVTAPLLHERMKKRVVFQQSPDSRTLREAMRLAHGHLDYLDWLIDNRSWVAGATLSMADLAAAAQISVADYLNGIDWRDHEAARHWYSVMKSRPSFRPLLSERMPGVHPPSHYAKVDL